MKALEEKEKALKDAIMKYEDRIKDLEKKYEIAKTKVDEYDNEFRLSPQKHIDKIETSYQDSGISNYLHGLLTDMKSVIPPDIILEESIDDLNSGRTITPTNTTTTTASVNTSPANKKNNNNKSIPKSNTGDFNSNSNNNNTINLMSSNYNNDNINSRVTLHILSSTTEMGLKEKYSVILSILNDRVITGKSYKNLDIMVNEIISWIFNTHGINCEMNILHNLLSNENKGNKEIDLSDDGQLFLHGASYNDIVAIIKKLSGYLLSNNDKYKVITKIINSKDVFNSDLMYILLKEVDAFALINLFNELLPYIISDLAPVYYTKTMELLLSKNYIKPVYFIIIIFFSI